MPLPNLERTVDMEVMMWSLVPSNPSHFRGMNMESADKCNSRLQTKYSKM